MAEYIFVPTGGRVSSDSELRPPLFKPAAEVGAAKAPRAKTTRTKSKATAGKGE